MIVVSGALGFIGSCTIASLMQNTNMDILAVDDFMQVAKSLNLTDHPRIMRIQRMELWKYLSAESPDVQFFIHLGARTDTLESNEAIFDKLNLAYSKSVWKYCSDHQIPLIYASTAATYGDGSMGFSDNHALVPRLQPQNAYGWSKQEFDIWALSRKVKPPFWVGLKFFNVYGPNEYHKGKMSSIVYHAHKQIKTTGEMKLFKSHHPEVADGEQKRDFVYVKDVLKIIHYFIKTRPASGLYNVGTGVARSFRALTEGVFEALGIEPNISYIDTPEQIRNHYQYHTQADIQKLQDAGYTEEFYSLEKGITDYVNSYLENGDLHYSFH